MDTAPGSTLADVGVPPVGRRAVWFRRAFLVLLLGFVGTGAAGYLGSHTTTATATGDGWILDVHYSSVARAGLDVPLVVTVTHAGGFAQQLTLEITADYFDLFETQGFSPDPAESTRDGDTLRLTFTAPAGDTFRFSYDAYVQPSSQQGHDATVAVLDGGATVVSTHISTHLLP